MTNYILETVESYNSYLTKLEKGSRIIADFLREDRIADALSMIVDFSEGMSWITRATELLRENNVTINLNLDDINNFLKEINSGLEIQDFLLVADIFEYEISNYFSKVPLIQVSNI